MRQKCGLGGNVDVDDAAGGGQEVAAQETGISSTGGT